MPAMKKHVAVALLLCAIATFAFCQPAVKPFSADTPAATATGNPFVAPKDWTLRAAGPATILAAPEGDSWLALVDVSAGSADEALAAAWKIYRPTATWPVKVATDRPDHDGWSHIRSYDYLTAPNEKRTVFAETSYAGSAWTVIIGDLSDAVAEKRGAQLSTVFSRLLPKGYSRESFAGKKAHALDAARIAQLTDFVELGRKEIGIPGVALGLIQNGRIVYADGLGVKELGHPEKPDAETLFMIASNTKALTTLLLAKLVDEHRLTWQTPVTSIMPNFRLGDAETTRNVQLRHLICACTGMPRQDLEWIFGYSKHTPAGTLQQLGTMQPTSKFGALFQYSNLMATAGGYTGAYVVHPEMEIGAAYDRAMQDYVFDPLGMKSTTFNSARAKAANHASAHAQSIDGQTVLASTNINESIMPARPAGAAWSSVHDMLRYISMELAEGKLADGKVYISSGPLLERRVPQVEIGKDNTYGMGLMVDHTYGTTIVHHGGDLTGYHSDMIWLLEHNVGAVILTNADGGWLLRSGFRRKLLEVLFDGHAEADDLLKADAHDYFAQIAAERKLLAVPASAIESAKLAHRYSNPILGDIAVTTTAAGTTFDFGEWKSEVASKTNTDKTVSFETTLSGMVGFEFVSGGVAPKRTLTIRDGQHEYVFEER